jgi:hypothetical protein
MPVELANRLVEVAERFEPVDFLERVRGLFAPHVELPEVRSTDWREHESAVDTKRADILAQLWRSDEIEGVVRLARMAAAPWTVGLAMADAGIVTDRPAFIEELLERDGQELLGVVRSYLLRTEYRHGPEALKTLLQSDTTQDWDPAWRAMVYSCLEFSPTTWQAVAGEGEAVSNNYWLSVPYTGRGSLPSSVVQEAASKFTSAGNLTAAIDLMAMYSDESNPQQVLETLALAASPQHSGAVSWNRLGTDVLRLLELISGSSDVDQDRVALLEWRTAPFVRMGPYEPTALQRKLSRDPAFFVEVLMLAFRAEDEPVKENPSEHERAVARRAYELLFAWHLPPGAKDDGRIDGDSMVNWVHAARKEAGGVGRLGVADIQIGEVMAYSPVGGDGVWPPEPVRDLVDALESDEFDRGIMIGVSNARSITSRSVGEGGQQERELVAKYQAYSAALRDRWPRTAAVVARISEQYERDARRVDVEAEWERREIGGTGPKGPAAQDPGG